MAQPNPILTGLLCRCPRCGQGRLFKDYLTLAASCDCCGLDFAFAYSGDGPAVFVIFLVAPLVILMALVLGAVVSIPPWMHLVIWILVTVLLSLALLPPFKGVLVNLQFRNDAHEGHQ